MPLDGSWHGVDRRHASPLWVDRGCGLLDFVVGSGVPIGQEHGFCGFMVVDRRWVLPCIGCELVAGLA